MSSAAQPSESHNQPSLEPQAFEDLTSPSVSYFVKQMHVLHSLVKRLLDARMPEDGRLVGSSSVFLLYYLRHRPGMTASQTQIATDRASSRSSISRVIDHLEELGMVERHEDPTDSRVNLVTLTQKGCTTERQMSENATQTWKTMLDGISPEDISTSAKTLLAMKRNVARALEAAEGDDKAESSEKRDTMTNMREEEQ